MAKSTSRSSSKGGSRRNTPTNNSGRPRPMPYKAGVTIQRLIGKVDNDFNISESDWIPRVGAWVIDALSFPYI